VAKRVQWRERRVAAVGPFDHGGAFARRHPPATIKSDEGVATRGFAQGGALQQEIARALNRWYSETGVSRSNWRVAERGTTLKP